MREVTESPLDPPSADDAASGFILPLRAIPIDEFEELAGNPMVESGSSAVIGNGDGVVPIPAIPIAGPKFCRQCGATRDAETDECGHCARRTLSRQAPVALDEPASGSVTSALALFFTLLLICVIGSLFGGAGDALRVDFGVGISLSVVTLLWCAVAWRGVLPLLLRVPHIGWFGVGIGAAFVTFAIATGVIQGLNRFLHLPQFKMSTAYLAGGYGWGMVILCICVQPAVIEELAFRGVVMSGLQRALIPLETILVSAMMFMTLHLSPMRFPHTLAMGMAAGYLRTRTKSIYPCIALHFTHNFLCIAAEWAGM